MLIAGGIDISFAVAASVVQYLTALSLQALGGGDWASASCSRARSARRSAASTPFWIYQFRIVSIVVTIATFNLFFGLLMFFSGGVSLYDLPDWLTTRIAIVSIETANGRAEITILVLVMIVCVAATWFLLQRTSTGRQLYAMGDNTEGARRIGVSLGADALSRLRLARIDGRHRRSHAGPSTRRRSSRTPSSVANSTCWPRSCSAARGSAAAAARSSA